MTGSRMRRAAALVSAVALTLTVSGGCSDDGDDGSVGVTTTDPSAQATRSSPTTSSEPSAAGTAGGCTDGDAEPPEGAATGTVPDVDGDGRDDTAWVAVGEESTTTVGVWTSAGGGGTHEWDSASPVTREILVVDADATPPVEVLASDGRTVELWAFTDCDLKPVRNAEGDTYTFSLGFTGHGTGVGCVDLGSGRELVGLDVVGEEGSSVEWSRTVVELDGVEAHDGQTTTGEFSRPEDAHAIELLHGVSCGDRTMDQHGIRATS